MDLGDLGSLAMSQTLFRIITYDRVLAQEVKHPTLVSSNPVPANYAEEQRRCDHNLIMWTHFFLTAKGMGQMIAEKSISSEARSAKHTDRQYGSSGIARLMGELTRVVEL